MNGLSEGFERAVDQNWSCMAKIHAQENFAKFLISNFLKGLTYSALYGVNNSSAPWMQFLVHCSLKHKALCWNQQVTFWNILTQEFHRERKLHVD